MSDLYNHTKKLVASTLKDNGFKADKLGEGLFKKVEGDISLTVQISGVWSHVESFVGIRFGEVNKCLQDAAENSGWKPDKISMFKLELLGLFREKVGDYCDSAEGLGVYCPTNSVIASPAEILNAIQSCVTKLAGLTDLSAALRYAQENRLLLPFGIYTIPAGARITSDDQLWDWCLTQVTPHVPPSHKADYDRLLRSLELQ